MAQIIRNKFSADLRIFADCVKKIDKTRFHKLMKKVCDSIISDSIHPENMDENDKIFEPRTQAEIDMWNMFREYAKQDMERLLKNTENGKKGGRPAQPKPVEQPKEPEKQVRGSFVPPTLEEVLEYAKEMNSIAGMGGFICSRQTATDFFNHYQSQGWLIGNGIHMTDWKPRIAKWAKIEEKNALEQ